MSNGQHVYRGHRVWFGGRRSKLDRLLLFNPTLGLEITTRVRRATGSRLASRAIASRDALRVSRRRFAAVVIATVSALTLVTSTPLRPVAANRVAVPVATR